jgi:translation initiation factor 5A
MPLKLIDATQVRQGTTIIIEKEPFTVKTIDTSKTGKHGHAKCRIEAIGIFSGKKKVIAVPGHERFEVPEVLKKKGQVLTVDSETVSVMDLETYETIDLPFLEEIKGSLEADKQVEFWDVEGKKMVMRVL